MQQVGLKFYVNELTLDVKEDGLFPAAPVVCGTDDVLAAIFEFDAVDDESVVVASVALHEFDTLLQFAVIVEPRDCGRGDGDDAAHEFGALSFKSEGGSRADHKARSSLAAVERKFVDAVALNLQFAQAAVFAEAADRYQEFVPGGVSGTDSVTHRDVAQRGDDCRKFAVVAHQPRML